MAKYCGNCGKELNEKQDVCLKCGVLVRKNVLEEKEKNSNLNIGWLFLGFFFPVIGIILYFCFRKDNNSSAKSVIIGVFISLVLLFLLIIMFLVSAICIYAYEDNDSYNGLDYNNGYYYDYDLDFD